MSISIIDYVSDYLYPELLPETPIKILLCEEHCLVPDSLKPLLIQSIEKSVILKGGLFVYRTGTGFNRGCMIGLALAMCPGSKLWTPRRELYSGIIPNIYLEFLRSAGNSIARVEVGRATPGERGNTGFEEVYNESLMKFVRTFLSDRAIRAQKVKSLRAQAKNLVDGVIISLGRKYGRSEIVGSEEIVNAIFDDLENEGVIKTNFNFIEYNDILIESFFGFNKTRLFEPGLKKNKSTPGKTSNPSLNTFSTPNCLYTDSSALPYTSLQFTPTPPSQSAPSSIFPTYSPQINNSEANINPLFTNQPLVAPTTNILKPLSSNPLMTRGGPESIFPQVQSEVKKTALTPSVDWQLHDEKITDEILSEVSNSEDIDTTLKLFKTCSRTIRNYLDANGVSITDQEMIEKVKKNMRLSIQTFFENKSFNLDDVVENMNGNTKLIKIV